MPLLCSLDLSSRKCPRSSRRSVVLFLPCSRLDQLPDDAGQQTRRGNPIVRTPLPLVHHRYVMVIAGHHRVKHSRLVGQHCLDRLVEGAGSHDRRHGYVVLLALAMAPVFGLGDDAGRPVRFGEQNIR